MSVPNVLANRYASASMRNTWSPENKIIAERLLWIAVLSAQRDSASTSAVTIRTR